MADIRKGVLTAKQHAINVLELARTARFDKNRLSFVYNSFAIDLKQNLQAPTNSTIIDEYLDELDQHQETWRERAGYYRIHRRPQQLSQAATQQTTPQEALKVAITTPLPEAFECRRCLAEFSSNSQLHKHIRESHSKKTAAERSAASSTTSADKSQPPECSASSLNPNETNPSPPATTQIAPPATPRKSAPLSVDQVTPQAAASGPVTPPPTYRAVSPPPPTYETKNYLTMADLYMRYAPLKSAKSKSVQSSSSFHPMATRSRTILPSLTVQDLYERFKKPVVRAAKWDPEYSTNRILAFNSKQASKSASNQMPRLVFSPYQKRILRPLPLNVTSHQGFQAWRHGS